MSGYYQDEWERKKPYVIRSLFGDIPMLSPVPEHDQESRQVSKSPLPGSSRDLSPTRSDSPLPPLIIERMPNRHDDPPEFYDRLEKRIKKVYRKLFFNEGGSSVEDILALYKDDYDEESHNLLPTQDQSYFVTAFEGSNTRISTIVKSTSCAEGDESGSEEVEDTGSEKRYEETAKIRSTDTRSSTVSDGNNEVTVDVMVHQVPTNYEKETNINLDDEGLNRSSSPIFMLKETKTAFIPTGEREPSQISLSPMSLKIADSEHDKSITPVERYVEEMRGHDDVSPSLGSLKDVIDTTDKSDISTNNGYKRKASLELQEEEESVDDANVISPKDVSPDLPDVPGDKSPIPQYQLSRSSTESTNKEIQQWDIPVKKKRKYENVSTQTSIPEKATVSWDDLKNNFFVGTPKIFKLCSCNDHKCQN